MSLKPLMLALRLCLELIAVASFGVLGWRVTGTPWRYLLVAALPVLAMTLWGVFAVPGDPSRKGDAPVPVPGAVRILVEAVVLWGGAGALWLAGLPWLALASGVVLAVYYVLARDRIGWLLRR
ncbi:hypothetical protein Afil01_46560 [Actinorhabdospora filicis]|uniref:DUF2568 domain-containing protein n=1 Tax=Actinorhabdospora filicis TaxID=1785913 RepID=A0A9W6WAP0_9ACTN|nr:YrdB family protein [Actinorhabdospora filicis]GLZ79849.1 hypothetical protein Afil01_46560 [Actinorhabdospora filicis]